jgi:hypothetical protein
LRDASRVARRVIEDEPKSECNKYLLQRTRCRLVDSWLIADAPSAIGQVGCHTVDVVTTGTRDPIAIMSVSRLALLNDAVKP